MTRQVEGLPLDGPDFADLAALNEALLASEPLVPGATRAVPGEGPAGAPIAFVGEQPGDEEDRQGRPSSGRRASCWIVRWRWSGSTARVSMSPMP